MSWRNVSLDDALADGRLVIKDCIADAFCKIHCIHPKNIR